ncbi:Spindly [Sergentomyia squamirostris]
MNSSLASMEKVSMLDREDLLEEYHRAEKMCRELQEQLSESKQKIHELSRNVQTLTATQEHLSGELESAVTLREAGVNAVRQKYVTEIEKLKAEIVNVQEDRGYLERQLEEARQQVKSQQEDFHKLLAEKEEANVTLCGSRDGSFNVTLAQNEELSEKIRELEQELALMNTGRSELIQEREELREKVEILESISQGRLEELNDKNEYMEELQAKLFEVNTEIASIKSDSSEMNKKGNSLFAEVDDQRQKMRAILAAQSKKYNQMKTIYQESQQEIKRLKQENSDIAEEFDYIRRMFMHADVTYKDTLQAQIGDLTLERDDLTQKLKWTEEKLNQAAENQGVFYIGDMLKYCNTQVSKIEENMKRIVDQKVQLDKSNHKIQQDLAKWRYKCLKYKCTLINRELLLENFGVKCSDLRDVPLDPAVEVDIDNMDDTFERDIKVDLPLGASKAVDFPIHEDVEESTVLDEKDEVDKENRTDNTSKIQYRSIEFPKTFQKVPEKSTSPVKVYADSATDKALPEGSRQRKPMFTIKKISFKPRK